MTKETKDEAGGGKDRFSEFRSQMITLGVLIAAVAGIYWLFPQFWKNYHIPLLFIAAGLAMPPLFGLWKFWMGYGFQVGIAPGLAFILMGVFILLFGYDIENPWSDAVSNLFWTNVVVLLLWFVFIAVLFRRRKDNAQKMQDYYRGETWRDYRWIIAPAVLILLFLFDASWGQSMLAASSLKKQVIRSTPPSSVQFHVEYPSQILFDDPEPSEIHLQATGPLNCTNLVVSGEGLLFAVKPSSDDSIIEWHEQIVLHFDTKTNASILLVQPANLLQSDSRTIQVKLSSAGRELETAGWLIKVEGSNSAQIREWKKNFLATGSTVVSLITAVFVGIKQIDEEKKRRKNEQIKQAIATFDTDAKNDLSKMLQEHQDLCLDWNEWDKGLQEQFRNKYSSLLETTFWDVVLEKTKLTEIVKDWLKVCRRIFENEEAKPIFILNLLQSALLQDEKAPLALLSILKEYPASINTAKIIASAFSPDLKERTIKEGSSEFPKQIRALQFELGFLETESFPLQMQFTFYAKEHSAADKMTAWLNAHGLNASPFADADSPFHSVFGKQLLMDWAAPGFALPAPSLPKAAFEFKNSWDTGAALFAYCQSLKPALKLKEETFFAIITPTLIEGYEADHPKRLYLHALAEQWIWSLAESPTLFYSLKDIQRDLAGRLLRWHDLSPSITVNKISEIAKIPTSFGSNIMDWLAQMSAEDLRIEEINALIGLRPSLKQRTVFLISTVDLNPHVGKQISLALHEQLDTHSAWLSAHHCGLVHFQTGNRDWQTVSPSSLIAQCNIRVQKCSKEGIVFNQLFDAPGEEPDAVLAAKADGSPGRMVRLGQTLLLRHVEKYPLDELLHIEDLEALEV